MIKQLTAALIIFCSLESEACFVPPAEQLVDPEVLIKRTNNIVLATVRSAEMKGDGYEIQYTFETEEVFKGSAKSKFNLIGSTLYEGGLRLFNNHQEEQFWENSGGREFNDTDCQIHPAFAVGATYLLFLDKPYHRKSFERIVHINGENNVNDKWLVFVQSQISLNKSMQPTAEASAD